MPDINEDTYYRAGTANPDSTVRWKAWLTAACVLGLVGVSQARPEPFAGRVVRVIDGDTVVVQDEDARIHKVRLAGIDAPECGMPFGQAAKRHLESLVLGRAVRSINMSRDRYRRTVSVLLQEQQDVGRAMIEAGLAWHDRRFPVRVGDVGRTEYARAEQEARDRVEALWMQSVVVPPWEWRAKRSVGQRHCRPEQP